MLSSAAHVNALVHSALARSCNTSALWQCRSWTWQKQLRDRSEELEGLGHEHCISELSPDSPYKVCFANLVHGPSPSVSSSGKPTSTSRNITHCMEMSGSTLLSVDGVMKDQNLRLKSSPRFCVVVHARGVCVCITGRWWQGLWPTCFPLRQTSHPPACWQKLTTILSPWPSWT